MPFQALSEVFRSRWLRGVLALALVAALVLLLLRLRGVITILLLGLLIAYLLNPLVERLERAGLGRRSAIALIVATVSVGVLVAVSLLVIAIVHQATELAVNLPGYTREAIARVEPFLARLRLRYPDETAAATVWIEEKVRSFDYTLLVRPIATFFGRTFANLYSFALRVVQAALVPVFAVYFLYDLPRFRRAAADLVPARHRERVHGRIREVHEVLAAFLRGQLLTCTVMGILYAIGLTIVGTPMSVPVGLLAGYGNLIPYLGTGTGIVLSVTLTIVGGGGWGALLGVAAVFACVQLLEAYYLTPRLVGGKIGLHPVVVIFVLLAGGELFGFPGLLLAVPAAAVGRVFARDLVAAYRRSALFGGEEAPARASAPAAPPSRSTPETRSP